MRSFAILAATLLLASVLAGAAAAGEPDVPGDHDVWELSRTDTTTRWLVVHNLAEGKQSGLFHVEILERRNGDPAW